jgi:hypothetical protein
MGQAIAYVLNQWDALCVYTTDGDLAIDNNVAENALRRVAVGRKNWLFCGSDGGGHTASVLFSLLATCVRHQVDPFAYLRDVLGRLAPIRCTAWPNFCPAGGRRRPPSPTPLRHPDRLAHAAVQSSCRALLPQGVHFAGRLHPAQV